MFTKEVIEDDINLYHTSLMLYRDFQVRQLFHCILG
jgi:hypothetical protein